MESRNKRQKTTTAVDNSPSRNNPFESLQVPDAILSGKILPFVGNGFYRFVAAVDRRFRRCCHVCWQSSDNFKTTYQNGLATTPCANIFHEDHKHCIFLGLLSKRSPFFTVPHEIFRREVQVWQIRNEGRHYTRREKLEKEEGELECVVTYLLEEVHKKMHTTIPKFPEIYRYRNERTVGCKVDLQKKEQRVKLINYLAGNHGSCLRGSLSQALEQVKAFRVYLTEKQFNSIDKFIRHFQDISDSSSDEEEEFSSNQGKHEKSNLCRMKEKRNKGLLRTANDMLVTALKNEQSIYLYNKRRETQRP